MIRRSFMAMRAAPIKPARQVKPKAPLSAQQQAALDALAAAPMTGAQLGEKLGTSREGAARTAASLVRRGLVARMNCRPTVYRKVAS